MIQYQEKTMLGENHSLLNELPEFKERITQLISVDPDFPEMAKQYDALDAEIRQLETANSPVSDDAVRQMKRQRSELKDSLYQRLISHID